MVLLLATGPGALEAELKWLAPPAEIAPEQPGPCVGLKTLLTTGGRPEPDRES